MRSRLPRAIARSACPGAREEPAHVLARYENAGGNYGDAVTAARQGYNGLGGGTFSLCPGRTVHLACRIKPLARCESAPEH